MICEFHWPTLVCSYSALSFSAASQACRAVLSARGSVEGARLRLAVGDATYVGGDLGQLRDRDGLASRSALVRAWETVGFLRVEAVADGNPISQAIDLPTRECCPRQPLCLFRRGRWFQRLIGDHQSVAAIVKGSVRLGGASLRLQTWRDHSTVRRVRRCDAGRRGSDCRPSSERSSRYSQDGEPGLTGRDRRGGDKIELGAASTQ